MFSGIVEELGIVKRISRQGVIVIFEIQADKVLADTKIGDSIAVNGVCLTVVKKEAKVLSFEAMPETVKITNLGSLVVSEKVNLERSLMVGDRISGHFVSGHIDCIGIIRKKIIISGNLCFEIAFPVEFMKYAVKKGSVALDGISLTVAEKRANTLQVFIIPHTLENTTLSFKAQSDKVNIEFDVLLKSHQ